MDDLSELDIDALAFRLTEKSDAELLAEAEGRIAFLETQMELASEKFRLEFQDEVAELLKEVKTLSSSSTKLSKKNASLKKKVTDQDKHLHEATAARIKAEDQVHELGKHLRILRGRLERLNDHYGGKLFGEFESYTDEHGKTEYRITIPAEVQVSTIRFIEDVTRLRETRQANEELTKENHEFGKKFRGAQLENNKLRKEIRSLKKLLAITEVAQEETK